MKKTLLFYVPVVYLFYSRLNSTLERASWLFVFPGIVFLMNYLWFGSNYSTAQFVLLFILYLCSWYSIYEIGYIENDAITIKEEENPTLRLSKAEIEYVNYCLLKIKWARFFEFVVLLIPIGLITTTRSLAYYFLSVVIMYLVFKMHNAVRDWKNVITYFALASLKYVSFTLFFQFEKFWLYLLFWLFIFPVPRTLENATTPRYAFKKIQKFIQDFDFFRVVYYGGILVVVSLFYLIASQYFDLSINIIIAFLGFLIFFTFRLSGYIFIKKSFLKR